MSGGNSPGLHVVKEIKYCHGKGGTFRRVGSGTKLVEETKAVTVCLFKYLNRVRHVRREGGQALFDRLFVTDICENFLKNRKLGALGSRDKKSGLSHELEKTYGLQANGLTAGVGTRDDQHVEILTEINSCGNNLFGIDKGMPSVKYGNVVLIVKLRHGGMHGLGKFCLCKYKIQMCQNCDIVPYGFCMRHEGSG